MESPPQPDPTALEIENLRLRVSQMDEKISALQTEQIRLQHEMQNVQRTVQDQAALARQQALDLERKMQASEAAREADKAFIIDTLSRKIADILGSRTATASPPPGGPAASPRTQSGYEHVVKPGESLSRIAAAYKVPVNAIMNANGIQNPNSIRAGQKLFIPEKN